MSASGRPMSDVIPASADWIQGRVSNVDPARNIVNVDGRQIKYDYLVVAPGINLDWDKIPGLTQTLGKDGVTSNYSPESAPMTAEMLKAFTGGNAIFTQPATPIKCAGAPQKIAYLAEEIFRRNGIREKSKISFHTGMGKLFSQDLWNAELTKIAAGKGIDVALNSDLVAIRPESKEAVFSHGGKESVQKYDFLHVTPPMSAPKFIKESGLGNDAGWCDVDQYTLQHKKYYNVFSLGDASSAPTSKTATAAAAQAGVVARNLVGVAAGGKGTVPQNKYDGYTACPITTSKSTLVLAEFSGYTMEPMATFEGVIDQSHESGFLSWVKAEALPWIYWNRMIAGSWNGPRGLRNFLQGVVIGTPVR
jgi:NADPH-dependent 2,4-dienoyl-CoA reductase/sulfur reductase-like enzyme